MAGSFPVKNLIRKFNQRLDKIILEDLGIIKDIKKYVIQTGGKRIRPIAHYCMSEMLGYQGKDWLDVGAISELIHAASLLHDDVVDSAEVRRGFASVGKAFGNKRAILMGDYLLACGIHRLNQLENPELMDVFTEVIRDLAVSELIQMEWEKNPKINLKIYDRIIHGKTASLFGAVCESAAILAMKSKMERNAARKFGLELGVLFQKRDDYLDYFTLASESGKVPYKDFLNGLYTYPVLLLLEKSSASEKRKIAQLLSETDDPDSRIENIAEFMALKNVAAEISSELYSSQKKLIEYLDHFPATPVQSAMKEQIEKLTI